MSDTVSHYATHHDGLPVDAAPITRAISTGNAPVTFSFLEDMETRARRAESELACVRGELAQARHIIEHKNVLLASIVTQRDEREEELTNRNVFCDGWKARAEQLEDELESARRVVEAARQVEAWTPETNVNGQWPLEFYLSFLGNALAAHTDKFGGHE